MFSLAQKLTKEYLCYNHYFIIFHFHSLIYLNSYFHWFTQERPESAVTSQLLVPAAEPG